jgi:hypothetical protein
MLNYQTAHCAFPNNITRRRQQLLARSNARQNALSIIENYDQIASMTNASAVMTVPSNRTS